MNEMNKMILILVQPHKSDLTYRNLRSHLAHFQAVSRDKYAHLDQNTALIRRLSTLAVLGFQASNLHHSLALDALRLAVQKHGNTEN